MDRKFLTVCWLVFAAFVALSAIRTGEIFPLFCAWAGGLVAKDLYESYAPDVREWYEKRNQ